MEQLIPIVFFVIVAVIVKLISDYKIKRMAIEKGLVNENLFYLLQGKYEAQLPSSLKWGIVLVCLGLGLFIGVMFPHYMSDQATAGCMFLLAGLGLVAYYFIASKLSKTKNKAE
jgi:hypothetical protein